MSRRVLLIATLSFFLGTTAAWLSAQAIAPQPLTPPITLSGSDIQFRVEARRGGVAVGRLMVRVDGEWVEADASGGLSVRRLQTK